MYFRLIAVIMSTLIIAVCIRFVCTVDRPSAQPAVAHPLCGLEQIQYFTSGPQFNLQNQIQAVREYKLEHSSFW